MHSVRDQTEAGAAPVTTDGCSRGGQPQVQSTINMLFAPLTIIMFREVLEVVLSSL